MRTATQLIALSVLGIMAALHFGARPATAQTQTCEHTVSAPAPLVGPILITNQGVTCVMTDVTVVAGFTVGAAIEILANNVILDLNGHKVGGNAAGAGTTAFGIRAFQRKNITIKNGTVRGFYQGIYLYDDSPFTTSQGHRVEGVRAEGNTAGGIEVHGRGGVIRGNQVVDTGGASFDQDGFGIVAKGPGARVLDNDVFDTTASGLSLFAIGIALRSAPASVAEGNRVGNAVQVNGLIGIELRDDSDNVVVV